MRDGSVLRRVFAFGLCLHLMLTPSVRASTATPGTLFLDEKPQEEIVANSFKAILIQDNPSLFERKKIQFLISRISQSQNTFIRNGEEHTAREAAAHLRRKYNFAFDEVKTAEQFILYIASQSMTTGNLYLMKTPDGKIYPIKDILTNELNHLNHTLNATQNTPTL